MNRKERIAKINEITSRYASLSGKALKLTRQINDLARDGIVKNECEILERQWALRAIEATKIVLDRALQKLGSHAFVENASDDALVQDIPFSAPPNEFPIDMDYDEKCIVPGRSSRKRE